MLNTQIWICFMLFLGVCDYYKNESDHANKPKRRCKARFDQSNHSKNVQNQDTLPVIDNNISRSTDLFVVFAVNSVMASRVLKFIIEAVKQLNLLTSR